MKKCKPRCAVLRRAVAGAGLLLAAAAHADLNVPAGANVVLGGGAVDLACTDLQVDGALDLQGAALFNVRHVGIGAGGALQLGSGSVTLAGNWDNAGALDAGTGGVRFADDVGCTPVITQAAISGNSVFHDLSISSSSGKRYVFETGSTQTVTGTLTLTGAAGIPLKLESSTPAIVSADIKLTGATQHLADLAVAGMSASGAWLAAGQTNQGSGPVRGWFGSPQPTTTVTPVPTLSAWSLLTLALSLAALALRRRPK